MVTVPEINAQTQLISFAFDGTIYDTHLRTSHVVPTKTKAVVYEKFTGNQDFVH